METGMEGCLEILGRYMQVAGCHCHSESAFLFCGVDVSSPSGCLAPSTSPTFSPCVGAPWASVGPFSKGVALGVQGGSVGLHHVHTREELGARATSACEDGKGLVRITAVCLQRLWGLY